MKTDDKGRYINNDRCDLLWSLGGSIGVVVLGWGAVAAYLYRDEVLAAIAWLLQGG